MKLGVLSVRRTASPFWGWRRVCRARMIPPLPEAAIGGVVAALIAALVSLLGLIISKEQKTSEFRQAWIDALRGELSEFLTRINAAQDAARITYKSDSEKLAAMQPHYMELNKSTFSIVLRLNHKEERAKAVLTCLGEFNKLAQDQNMLTVENIRPVQANMLVASQALLKYEWRRVRDGERTFRIAKALAAASIIASLVAFAWLLFTARPTAAVAHEHSGSTASQTNQPAARGEKPRTGAPGSRTERALHAKESNTARPGRTAASSQGKQ